MIGRLPVVVALGPVDPALVTGVFDGHCRFVSDPGDATRRATAATFTAAARGVLDVLAGREPQAVANPAWRTHRRTKEIHP